MKTFLLHIVGMGLVLAGAPVVAQSPQSTTSREVISATGCVRLGGPDGAGAAHEGLGSGFVLQGVRIAPHAGLVQAPAATASGVPAASDGSQTTTSAAPGSGASAAEARARGADLPAARDTGLRLVADRGVELADHVGHRVMVTGRLSSFAAPGGIASTSSGRTLTVTRVDIIAPACTTGS